MGRLWTPDEDKWLSWWWGTVKLVHIAKRLNRSEEAVYQRARKLKLGLGKPRGYASLDDIARKSGYSENYLVTIFKAQGVHLRRRYWSCPRGTKNRAYHRIIVEEERAMAAVHAWSEMECLNAAAKRLELGAHLLRAELIRMGHPRPPKGKFWYLPSRVFEGAAARAKAVIRGPQHEWSVQDEAFVRERWHVEPRAVIAAALGRSVGALSQKARRMGLVEPKSSPHE